MSSFTTRPTYRLPAEPSEADQRRHAARDWETLRRMANAAAKQALGKSYSDEDRAECAAHLISWTMARHLTERASCLICGGPAAYVMPQCMDDYGTATLPTYCVGHASYRPNRRRIMRPDWTNPGYSPLYSEAANYRRSIDAARRRESEHAPTLGATAMVRPEGFTPDRARDRAMDMLDALGLPRLGKAFPAAYVAARQYVERTDGGGIMLRTDATKEALAELGLNRNQYDLGLTRHWRKRVPSVAVKSAGAHAAALGVIPDQSTEHGHAARLPDNGWRDHAPKDPAEHAPITVLSAWADADAEEDYQPCRSCGAQTDVPCQPRCPLAQVKRDVTAPDWTQNLHPATAARLSHADRIRREEAAKRTPEERTALRATVGLPATVR